MEHIDVFHGDADGICSMRLLRLAEPRPGARLESGVKRDIGLLARLRGARQACISVTDISLDVNRAALMDLLEAGCQVLYVDHHFSGEIPRHPGLRARIDHSALTCASLLAADLAAELSGGAPHAGWAVMGAHGDNLGEQAAARAREAGLDQGEEDLLRRGGVALTYNSYGLEAADLHIHPEQVLCRALEYEDPVDFLRSTGITAELEARKKQDMALALAVPPLVDRPCCRIYELPPEPWARRVSGVLANQRARERPGAAHALIFPLPDGSLRISVRAPLGWREMARPPRPGGCAGFCGRWPTGGGRAAAGGVDALPAEERQAFIQGFQEFFAHPGD